MDTASETFLKATRLAFSRAKSKAMVLEPTDPRIAELRLKLHELQAKRDLPDEIACAIIKGQLVLVAFSEETIPHRLPDAFLGYEWGQPFKPLRTATFFWRGGHHTATPRAYLFPEEPYQGYLENTPILVVIAERTGIQFAFQIDLSSSARIGASEGEIQRQQHYVDDPLAAKLYGHVYASGLGATPSEKLLKTYIDRLAAETREAMLCIEHNLDQQNILLEKQAAKNSFLGQFYDKPRHYQHIYHFFKDRLTTANPAILEWVFKIHQDLKGIGLGCLAYQASHLFSCALYSPAVTKRGLSFPSHDLDNNFELVALDPEAMGPKAGQFWPRIPWDFLSFYREVVGATNCPADPRKFFSEAPLFEGDLGEAHKLVENLLTEATELKQATIPPGAYHPIDQGSNIKAVKLFELGSEVAAVFADSSGDFFLATCNPRDRAIRVAHPDSNSIYQAETIKARQRGEIGHSTPKADEVRLLQNRVHHTLERFTLGVKLFLATLIRDFWVLEERESVFGSARLVRKVPKLHADRHTPVLVYLPRIKYVRKLNAPQETDLNYKVRAPHWVRDHIRKSANPSEDRLSVARRLGIFVPEGFTFVGRHRRGDRAAEVVYRSVSALRCFGMVQKLDHKAKDAWFQFERQTAAWLKANGYEIEQIAGSTRGDRGIDVQARKADHSILVQCKFWSEQRKVGPSVIRELLGSLATFPKGASGIVVTSSRLSDTAKDLCLDQGIRYYELVDFSREITVHLA